ncbi:MAG: hypothetical protein AAFR79_05085 [Pseudomonadota bacterium]
MDITKTFEQIDPEFAKAKLCEFLVAFNTPAFGALPKREVEIRIFELMRDLGLIDPQGDSLYAIMTDLRITRAKTSQLVFDLDVRDFGGSKTALNERVREALVNTRFAKDGDYFVLEVENPLLLAHLRQEIRELGYFSDTSFNSALVRMPLEAAVALMERLIPKEHHDAIRRALVEAGAPEAPTLGGVLRSAMKTLGTKVLGDVAGEVAKGASDYLGPVFDAAIAQITETWAGLFADD